MHTGAVKEGQNVLLIDDLIATGGTLAAGVKLVEQVTWLLLTGWCHATCKFRDLLPQFLHKTALCTHHWQLLQLCVHRDGMQSSFVMVDLSFTSCAGCMHKVQLGVWQVLKVVAVVAAGWR